MHKDNSHGAVSTKRKKREYNHTYKSVLKQLQHATLLLQQEQQRTQVAHDAQLVSLCLPQPRHRLLWVVRLVHMLLLTPVQQRVCCSGNNNWRAYACAAGVYREFCPLSRVFATCVQLLAEAILMHRVMYKLIKPLQHCLAQQSIDSPLYVEPSWARMVQLAEHGSPLLRGALEVRLCVCMNTKKCMGQNADVA